MTPFTEGQVDRELQAPPAFVALKEIEASLGQIRSNLIARFGEDDVARFFNGQISDHAMICKMNGAFFSRSCHCRVNRACPFFALCSGEVRRLEWYFRGAS